MNKICVYAICKNESAFVDRWVDSMSEADSIVVLDTGSTDDTVEKLKSRGVKVEQKIITPWRFDIARNESLKLVPDDCNILICTDLDEILQPGWAKVLREKWNPEMHTRAKYKYIWSHTADGEPGRIFNYNKIHDKNWIWKYPVHELLANINTESELYNVENELDLFNDITLEHFPDPEKSRSSYLPLLELRAEESPNDLYGLIYLAHEYRYRNMYEKSNIQLEKVLNSKLWDKNNAAIEIASCYLFMGDNYYSLNETDNAIAAYNKCIIEDPTYREGYIGLARVYVDLKKYQEAIFYIKKCLSNCYRHYSWLERDISWSYEPYDILSIAYYYSGHVKESLCSALKALSYDQNNLRLRENVKIILENIKEF